MITGGGFEATDLHKPEVLKVKNWNGTENNMAAAARDSEPIQHDYQPVVEDTQEAEVPGSFLAPPPPPPLPPPILTPVPTTNYSLERASGATKIEASVTVFDVKGAHSGRLVVDTSCICIALD